MAPDANFGKIRPLPTDLRATVSSAIHITSLNDVILQLVKNAIDASAGSVHISIDYNRGFCSASDNGSGIPQAEFRSDGNIARLNCTSRFGQLRTSYGGHGRFLASLSAISVLQILSRTKDDHGTSSILVNMGKLLVRNAGGEEALQSGSNTKVVVRNLFGNLPVRIRERAMRYSEQAQIDKDFRSLKLGMVGLILASPYQFTLKVEEKSKHKYKHVPYMRTANNDTSTSTFSISRISSTLFQAGYTSVLDTARWKSASARSTSIYLRLAVCLDPIANKAAQFVSIGMHSLDRKGQASELWLMINDKFEASAFGEAEFADPEYQPLTSYRQRPSRSKAPDRWPMFYLRIDLHAHDDGKNFASSLDLSSEEQNCLMKISELLASVVDHWLIANRYIYKRPQVPESFTDSECRKGREQAPLIACATEEVRQSRPSGFEMWSRVKHSAPHKPLDILSGLPFLDGKDDKGEATSRPMACASGNIDVITDLHSTRLGFPLDQSRDTEDRFNEDGTALSLARAAVAVSTVEEVYWRNARTGEVVPLDARTGFTVTDSTTFRPTSAAVATSTHTLGEVMENERVSRPPRPGFFRTKPGYSQPRKIGDNCCTMPKNDIGQLDLHHDGVDDNPSGHGKQFFSSVLDVEHKITKAMLTHARVLRQVDGKFILVSTPLHVPGSETEDELLVLVDQHAADERIKVEALFRDVCSNSFLTCATPILFEVSREEKVDFQDKQSYFREWGIIYEVLSRPKTKGMIPTTFDKHDFRSQDDEIVVQVTTLPEVVAERCRLEPKLLINLLRQELLSEKRPYSSRIDSVQNMDSDDWTIKIGSCPQGLLDMLISRSCRSAVMFNDQLTTNQCGIMMRNLSTCAFPFMCAHGRPSMIALGRVQRGPVGTSHNAAGDTLRCTEDFGGAWAAWS